MKMDYRMEITYKFFLLIYLHPVDGCVIHEDRSALPSSVTVKMMATKTITSTMRTTMDGWRRCMYTLFVRHKQLRNVRFTTTFPLFVRRIIMTFFAFSSVHRPRCVPRRDSLLGLSWMALKVVRKRSHLGIVIHRSKPFRSTRLLNILPVFETEAD